MNLQLLQKTGQIERTVDREFTEEEAKYRMYASALEQCSIGFLTRRSCVHRFEKECQALQKDGKAYWDAMRGKLLSFSPPVCDFNVFVWTLAMTAAQARIAETLETFYGAADRASDGAMAGHAYKRSVDELDSSFSRELVCCRLPISSQSS